MSEASFEMSVPLDSDHFVRRACPTCDREFKWLHGPAAGVEGVAPQDGGYFCPYCGVQAPLSDWMTVAQAELATNIVARKAVGPMVERLGANWSYQPPDALDPLTESDDMIRVELACHPSEPVKVLDWDRPVFCLICGASSGDG